MKRCNQGDFFSSAQARLKDRRPGKKGSRRDAATSSAGTLSANIRLAAKAAAMDTGYKDTILSAIEFNTATDAVNTLRRVQVNPIPVGATQNQRVGKKILMKGLQIRGLVYSNTGSLYNDVAIIVVYDKRPNTGTGAAMPLTTDILAGLSAQDMNNDNNASRFRIIRRIDMMLINQTAVAGYSIDEYIDLKKLPTVYQSVGTGQYGDCSEGALLLIFIGSVAAGTAAATFTGNCRVRYYDP